MSHEKDEKALCSKKSGCLFAGVQAVVHLSCLSSAVASLK